MTTLAFFNNKGGVGKTTLVYHLAHMLVDLGFTVLMLDLDPQSNLSAMCLDEDELDRLWSLEGEYEGTVFRGVRPLLEGREDIIEPQVQDLREGLGLVVGDPRISMVEDDMSIAWSHALDGEKAAYRLLSAVHQMGERIADARGAELILVDLGPSLGALNRTVLLGVEGIMIPLAPDPFSIQGLRSLGPKLAEWRRGWAERLQNAPPMGFELPSGMMRSLGYIVMRVNMRLSRPFRGYDRWIRRIPGEYHRSVAQDGVEPVDTESDPDCMGVLRHYRSLLPLAQDVRKPMFHLKPADGAIGAYAPAVERCRDDFERLARTLVDRLNGARS